MGLVDFQIMFEKPLPTYFPGEVVNGQLVVNLSSEKKMAKIKVRTHHSTVQSRFSDTFGLSEKCH